MNRNKRMKATARRLSTWGRSCVICLRNRGTTTVSNYLQLFRDLGRIAKNYKSEWDIHLPAAVLGLNDKPHWVTKYSPFEVMYRRAPPGEVGCDLESDDDMVDEAFFDPACQLKFIEERSRAMSDVYAKVSQNLQKGQKKQRDAYNKTNWNKPRISSGSQVYLSTEVSILNALYVKYVFILFPP